MLAIRKGYILTLDDNDNIFDGGDLIIDGNRISYVGPKLEIIPDEAEVIDASGKLIMPGLINVHAHSDELLVRGTLDNMPLNLWGLYSSPPMGYGPLSPRLIYLRTMLGAIEMLKNGITTVQDDLSESPRATLEGTGAARQAYIDSGMRAYVSCNQGNLGPHLEHPFLAEVLPRAYLERMEATKPISTSDLLSQNIEIIDNWHGAANGRLGVTLSFSAPHRGTEDYIQGLNEISMIRNLPIHMHILETKPQRIASDVWYGKSQIKHANDLGLITNRATIAHSIWVDDDDIKIMGEARTNVAHNPISNLKLISGIMPYRRLVSSGVNVALGTDGASSNDSFNLFVDMRFAALIHKVTSLNSQDWPTAREVIAMATSCGARSILLQNELGKIMLGFKADLIFLNLKSTSFTPFNNPLNHLVYCETGSSVDSVIVDGNIIVSDRILQTVDEGALLEELRIRMAEHNGIYSKAKEISNELYPFYEKMYKRAIKMDIGIDRFAIPKQ